MTAQAHPDSVQPLDQNISWIVGVGPPFHDAWLSTRGDGDQTPRAIGVRWDDGEVGIARIITDDPPASPSPFQNHTGIHFGATAGGCVFFCGFVFAWFLVFV